MRITLFSIVVILVCAGPAFAQAPPHPNIGGFETQGTIAAGYRFTDVSGRREKYDELFSLRDGLRLFDFTLMGRSEDARKFSDSWSVTGSGIGGDPLMASQARLSKNNVYDLRVNYRQSYFYWNRNDQTNHPTGIPGLTTNHDWGTVRRLGSINASAYVTPEFRLNFEYNRVGRDGTTFTTRTLEHFGAPASFGGFLRANPYVIEAPVDETTNRGAAGFAYSRGEWNIFYRAGYQRSGETVRMSNLFPGQRSINTSEAATANELLQNAQWRGSRRLSAPLSEFSYNGQASPWLRLRGGYIYYRYEGPATATASFAGTARTTGTAVAPYSITTSSSTDSTEPNHVIDQGFTIDLNDQVKFHTDYRYSRFKIDSDVQFQTSGSFGNTAGTTDMDWREGMHILDVALEIVPANRVMIRPGVRLFKRDVTVLHDGAADPLATKRSKFASPLVSVYYSPTARFSLRGDIQNTTNGTPYTRISPRWNFNTRWIARYQLGENLSIENNLRIRTAEYAATEYRNSIRSNATAVTYTFGDRLAVTGGFIYDSFLATAAVTFLRGTPPLDATWRDQTINRVWHGSIETTPVSRLSLALSGSYDRTTGVGEISGELPAFGPVRWPLVTGTVSVDFLRAGKLSIDLQRTYYIEEIMSGDNFSANILGLRWTTEF